MLAHPDLEKQVREAKMRAAVSELSTIAAQLTAMVQPTDGRACHPSSSTGVSPTLAVRATEWLRFQNARNRFLPSSILRDYAWNMLVDLFVHDHHGKKVSVSSACISSGGPPTTALRWLTALEKAGMITRSADLDDRRKVYVEITPRAREAIADWLSSTK